MLYIFEKKSPFLLVFLTSDDKWGPWYNLQFCTYTFRATNLEQGISVFTLKSSVFIQRALSCRLMQYLQMSDDNLNARERFIIMIAINKINQREGKDSSVLSTTEWIVCSLVCYFCNCWKDHWMKSTPPSAKITSSKLSLARLAQASHLSLSNKTFL
jgi:hypothetical protein